MKVIKVEERFEKCKKEFNSYANQFNMNIEKIKQKYQHSFRVVQFAEQIAKSENLSEHDVFLVKVCALLHDIARFRQFTEYQTFNDKLSFDHGDIGCEILLENNYISNYLTEKEDQDICLKAVKNHNKYAIENGLSAKERYFCNMIRDSDKIDIMQTQRAEIKDGQTDIMPEIIDSLQQHILYHKDKETFERNDISTVALHLCFVFDFNFQESYRILLEKKIIEKKMNLIRNVCEKNLANEIEENIDSYIKTKM